MVIPIGVPSFTTGKTKFGWSIYDNGGGYIFLTTGSYVLYAANLDVKPSDTLEIYNNDSGRLIASSLSIIDSAPAKRENVLQMLKKNGYDYYPVAPYQPKRRTRDIRGGMSIKGYEQI